MGQRNGLSRSDILKLNAMYECERSTGTSTGIGTNTGIGE